MLEDELKYRLVTDLSIAFAKVMTRHFPELTFERLGEMAETGVPDLIGYFTYVHSTFIEENFCPV